MPAFDVTLVTLAWNVYLAEVDVNVEEFGATLVIVGDCTLGVVPPTVTVLSVLPPEFVIGV